MPHSVHAKLLLEAAAPSGWPELPPPPLLPPAAVVRLACAVGSAGALAPIRALYALSRIGELAAAIQRHARGAPAGEVGSGLGLGPDGGDGGEDEDAAAGAPDPVLAAAYYSVVDGVAGRLDPLVGAALGALSERASRWDSHSESDSAGRARAMRLYYLTRALARLLYEPAPAAAAAFAAAAGPLAPLMNRYCALAVLHRLQRWHTRGLLPADAAPALAAVAERTVELEAEEGSLQMLPAVRAWMMDQLMAEQLEDEEEGAPDDFDYDEGLREGEASI